MTIEEIRDILERRYHDAKDYQVAPEKLGIVREDLLIAMAIVLVSAAVSPKTERATSFLPRFCDPRR